MTSPHRAVVDGTTSERSDEDLVDAARGGDDTAYAVLWERHVASAHNAARAVSPNVDHDDLVSEAFTSILSAIRRGGGPQDGFRPYLFATIRNVAASWGRRTSELPLDDLDGRAADSSAEFAELVADRSVLAQAFRQLPARWRTLLWYIEVEGMKPREVAPLLGMSANAVSALAYRAREGFKQAWLQAHISDPARPAECRWACELLVAGERRAVERGDRRRLDAHLRTCQPCRIVAADIEHVAQKLRVVLLPLVLGGAGALAYTADATPAVAAVVAGSPTGGGGASGSGEMGVWGASGGGAGAAGAGTPAVPAVGIAAGVAAAAAVAVGVIVFAVAPWNAPASEPPAAVTTAADTDAAEQAAPPAEEAAAGPEPPAAAPESADGPLPVPEPRPAPQPAPAPKAGSMPLPVPAPAPQPSRTPQPTPTPSTSPSAQTATPMLDAPLDLSAAIPAPITGTGAAGAAVTLRDETGATLVTVTAGDDGRFAATLPGDLLRAGMTVHAVQTAPDLRPSEPSAAVGPFALPTPVVTATDGSLDAPLEDADFDGRADDLFLMLGGQPGRTVAVSVDGVWTGNLHVLSGRPLERVVYDIAAGDHVIGIRYVDPDTGREGRVASALIRATAR